MPSRHVGWSEMLHQPLDDAECCGGEHLRLVRAKSSRGLALAVIGGDTLANERARRSDARRLVTRDLLQDEDPLPSLRDQGLLTKAAIAALSAEQIRTVLAFSARAAAITVSRAGDNPPTRSELK